MHGISPNPIEMQQLPGCPIPIAHLFNSLPRLDRDDDLAVATMPSGARIQNLSQAAEIQQEIGVRGNESEGVEANPVLGGISLAPNTPSSTASRDVLGEKQPALFLEPVVPFRCVDEPISALERPNRSHFLFRSKTMHSRILDDLGQKFS